jgi:hypothetical protein
VSSLFPQPVVRPAKEHGACVLADAVTALVYSLLDLKIDGLVESTLNFLLQVRGHQVLLDFFLPFDNRFHGVIYFSTCMLL